MVNFCKKKKGEKKNKLNLENDMKLELLEIKLK